MVKQLQFKRYFSWQGLAQRGVDCLIVGFNFLAAHYIYVEGWTPFHERAAMVAALCFLLVSGLRGTYRPQDQKLKMLGYGLLVTSWVATCSLLLLLAYITKTSSIFSRIAVAGWLLGTPFLMIVSRWPLGYLFSLARQVVQPRRVALAGYSESAKKFMDSLATASEPSIRVSGLYFSSSSQEGLRDKDKPLLKGNLDALVQDARQGAYDEVYIALEMSEEDSISRLISELSDCSIAVYLIPDIFTINLLASQLYHFEGMPVVSIYDSPMDARDLAVKRMEDVVLSLLFLSIAALPMALIAVVIKLTSRGPVVFKQSRYGIGGEAIEIWKFRSMTVCEDGAVVVQATKNDSRLTAVGAFLRRTSLDELPQFINVLKGDMSIVGPRPHAVAHNELYRKEIRGYMLRHLVKPGITGWAQVNGWRGETDTLEKMEMRVKYDLEYIKYWSMWFDLKIIAMTIFKGFFHKNAY